MGERLRRVKIKPISAKVYFLPVETRVPFKFGREVLTNVTCLRVCIAVRDTAGNEAIGWGETPLNVQWAWPSSLSYRERDEAMKAFCCRLAEAWTDEVEAGHALVLGHRFLEERLAGLLEGFNSGRDSEAMPHLAALICCSAYDIALHDAYGNLLGMGVFETLGASHLDEDLSAFLEPADGSGVVFEGKYPGDFLAPATDTLVACHLVGGQDLLRDAERDGSEPDDGYPVTLEDWIERDGLTFLKIKLRGNDAEWDLNRILEVGAIAIEKGVPWLTCDFNCTVTCPEYVNTILDQLRDEWPRFYQMVLYVEQPFPYDLESNRIDVHSVSSRKPLFMDESAHDWRLVRLGRQLGWNGVALKTCKTFTGAILSLCWAKAHGMSLMVQDLTNPMLAQIPHVLLAARAGTIMGVETNAMQFYPEVSRQEAQIHPGLYRRRDGRVDLSSIEGSGFGYRVEEIGRSLPEPVCVFGEVKI